MVVALVSAMLTSRRITFDYGVALAPVTRVIVEERDVDGASAYETQHASIVEWRESRTYSASAPSSLSAQLGIVGDSIRWASLQDENAVVRFRCFAHDGCVSTLDEFVTPLHALSLIAPFGEAF